MGLMMSLRILFVLFFCVSSWAQSGETSQPSSNPGNSPTLAEEDGGSEKQTATISEESNKKESIEKVEVTGSYIRRTDIEGPSPVVIIDRQQIEASGMNTVGSVLQQSTASPFGNDGNTVNLKGLGSAKTLVLINGQRAPGTGSSYQSGPVSTDFIPLAAVERIEILKDGASATYGSDALGGVVNIITRKDIDGLAFVNQYNLTNQNGGDSNRLSLAYGKNTSDSQFMTSLQTTIRQGDRLSDRDYSGLPLEVNPLYSTNYRDDSDTFRAGPNCQRIDQDSGLCTDYDRSRLFFKDGYAVDWVTQYTKDIASGTQFYSTLAAGYDRSERVSPVNLQTPGVGFGASFTGSETPDSWNSLDGYSGGDTRIFHRFDDLPNTQLIQEYYLGLITGFKGYFGNSDWQWDATLNNQINTETTTETNVGSFPGAMAALTSGAYNPFDLTQRDTTGIGVDTFNRNRFMVNWAEFKTNGELGNFLGFNWSSAFGTSLAHFEYSDKRSAIFLENEAMGQSGAIGSAGREVYAAFAEASGVLNNQLEVQFSLRGDFYSDFGETINPKIATRYQPFKWLTFRASAGTGFQAPTLQDMNAALEGFFNNFQDPIRCNQENDCNLKSTTASQATNPNLKEETSLSLNFGTIIQPTRNFTLGLDYWHVKVEDVIGSAFGQALRIEEDFGRERLADYGINIQRENNSPTGEIQRIVYTLENLGTQEAQGLDFNMSYVFKTAIGEFTLGNELSYMFHFYQQFVDLYGREDVIGRQGVPRWRNNARISYSKGAWGGMILARSTADMLQTGNISSNLESLPSPTQFDLSASYNDSYLGQFQVGVINLGNIRPRFSAAQTIDTTLFRPFETYYLTYRRDF